MVVDAGRTKPDDTSMFQYCPMASVLDLTTPNPVGGSRHESSVGTNWSGPWAAILPLAAGGEKFTETPPATHCPPSRSTLQPATRGSQYRGSEGSRTGAQIVAATQAFVGHEVTGQTGEAFAQKDCGSTEAQRSPFASWHLVPGEKVF